VCLYNIGMKADTRTGIAEGSKRDILDIVALNVRSEIAFGQFSDGCTSLFWHTPKTEWLGQNWDVRLQSLPPLRVTNHFQVAKRTGTKSNSPHHPADLASRNQNYN
jgi:hypothetical protein